MRKVLLLLALCCSFALAQGTAPASAPAAPATASTAPAMASGGPMLSGIRLPLVLGGALGFGSGTGVGSDRGIGLRQIEPLIGIWYPGLGYFRVGYGMFGYEEKADDTEDYEVDHSEMDFELGLQFFGDMYVMGNYSRVKELSDLGDVAWNEWGLGIGSVFFIFSRTLLFAEVGYRWVLNHYDPFLDKKVDGGRLQLNIGFAVYAI